jgi:cytidylate kinase
MKSEKLSREATLKLIEDRDKASTEYLRRFYNVDWEDPTNYDILLNTAKMDLDIAAEMISSVVRKMW